MKPLFGPRTALRHWLTASAIVGTIAPPSMAGTIANRGPSLPAAVAVGSNAGAIAQETAQELYVEGWMREHVDRDLEAALIAYGQCLEVAAAGEREIAARALLRIAIVAETREEAEVASAQFARLQRDYAGTTAAAEAAAREQLEPASNSDPEISLILREARRSLVQLLLGEVPADDSRGTKLDLVLRTLSVDEILATVQQIGAPFDALHGASQAHEQKLVALLDTGEELLIPHVLRAMRSFQQPYSETLLRWLSAPQHEVNDEIFWRALRRRLDGQDPLFRAIADAHPSVLQNDPREVVAILIRDESTLALDLFDRFLATGPHLASAFEWMVTPWSSFERDRRHLVPLAFETSIARRMREEFRKLPAEQRWRLADEMRKVEGDRDYSTEFMQLLDEDPEPLIRAVATRIRIQSGNAATREDGLRQLASYSQELRAEIVEPVGTSLQTTQELSLLLDCAKSPSELQALYSRMLPHRTQQRLVVEAGLQRGDVELLRAILAPSGLRFYAPDHEAKLVQLALSCPDVEIRAGIVSRFAPRAPDSMDAALSDEAPPVRLAALRVYGDRAARSKALATLLRDPNEEVHTRAIHLCTNVEALRSAAEGVSTTHREQLIQRAQFLGEWALVEELCDPLPPSNTIKRQAWSRLLWTGWVGLGQALDSDDSFIRKMATELWQRIQREPYYSTSGVTNPDDEDPKFRALLRLFFASHARQGVRDAGEALARLGAREELAELALSGSAEAGKAAQVGLLLLGDAPFVLRLLDQAANRGVLVFTAYTMGQREALMDRVSSGSISPSELWHVASSESDTAFLAELLVAEDDAFTSDYHLHPDQETQVLNALLAKDPDAPTLLRVLRRTSRTEVVEAMLDSGAGSALLDALPSLPQDLATHAIGPLIERYGWPTDSPGPFPRFLETQRQWIDYWRGQMQR